MKIAVDCRMLKKSGIGVYLTNILYYWLQEPYIHWLLIGNKKELSTLPLSDNCEILECDIPIFSYKELFAFPIKKINKCNIFYSPNFNIPFGLKIPVYITVHDVVFLDYKDFDSKLGIFIRKVILKCSIEKAKKIFTVSQFSKERIEAHFGKTKNITVASNGLNVDLLSFNAFSKSKIYNFDYIIFIGNIKRHKGIDVLIEAMEGLDKKLVVVGDITGLKTSDKAVFEKMSQNKNIILPGRIESNATLYNLIEQADALVMPSRYEGFGIPPLEALTLGTQAIISDIPVFKEVYGNLPVIFFENENVNNLREKILNLKNDVIDKEKVKSAFSYKDTAKKILLTFDVDI